MKKVLWSIITLVLLAIGVAGFMFINNSEAKESPAKQIKQVTTTKQEVKTEQKAPEPKYNIDKIVVAVQGDLVPKFPEFQPLNDFSMALLNEIGKENNITIETKEMPTFDDVRISLSRKETDLQFMTFAENQPDLIVSYSYLNAAVYHDGDKVTQPERDWVFVLHQDNKELSNLLNDHIAKFKENGKLDELKKQYLGQ